MNYKKLILAILLVTVFSIAFGMITCGGLFSWVYELAPTNVWRPMENVSFPLMLLSNLLTDAIFVFVYVLIKKGIPAQNKLIKGLAYGLMVWGVGILPGMISTYLFMTVATTVVIYWTISGLILALLKGLITSAIYGE